MRARRYTSGNRALRGSFGARAQASAAEAYGTQVVDVAGILGTAISPADPDRAIIEPWASGVGGRILDVGSGTGRWTAHLDALGHTVEGLEPAERLVNLARAHFPGVTFHHGAIADLVEADRRWDGILSWYSLIHMGRGELPEALAILRTALRDGGSLLLSFFSGPRLEAFSHPIATAYRWPMADMEQALADAGFADAAQQMGPFSAHAVMSARAIER